MVWELTFLHQRICATVEIKFGNGPASSPLPHLVVGEGRVRVLVRCKKNYSVNRSLIFSLPNGSFRAEVKAVQKPSRDRQGAVRHCSSTDGLRSVIDVLRLAQVEPLHQRIGFDD